MYTGSQSAEVFTVLFDGFGEDVREATAEAGGVDKLRQVSPACLDSQCHRCAAQLT